MTRTVVTRQEAADMLGCDVHTVGRWVRIGALDGPRQNGRLRRLCGVYLDTITPILEQRTRTDMVSVDEAARMLMIGRSSLVSGTVYRGEVEAVRDPGGRILGITLASIEALLKERAARWAPKPPPEPKVDKSCPVCGWKSEVPGQPCRLCQILEGRPYYWLREAAGVL